MSVHIRRLLHAGIPVSDLERSLRFYRDLLDFELVSRREISGEHVSNGVQVPEARISIALLRTGDAELELLQYLHPVGRSFDGQNNDVGAMHVAFEVTDLQATYDRLSAAGVPCNTPPFPSTYPEGWGWFYARDPDGITVEFNGPFPAT